MRLFCLFLPLLLMSRKPCEEQRKMLCSLITGQITCGNWAKCSYLFLFLTPCVFFFTQSGEPVHLKSHEEEGWDSLLGMGLLLFSQGPAAAGKHSAALLLLHHSNRVSMRLAPPSVALLESEITTKQSKKTFSVSPVLKRHIKVWAIRTARARSHHHLFP